MVVAATVPPPLTLPHKGEGDSEALAYPSLQPRQSHTGQLHPLRPFGPPPPSRGRRAENLAPLPPLDGEGASRSEAGGVQKRPYAIAPPLAGRGTWYAPCADFH